MSLPNFRRSGMARAVLLASLAAAGCQGQIGDAGPSGSAGGAGSTGATAATSSGNGTTAGNGTDGAGTAGTSAGSSSTGSDSGSTGVKPPDGTGTPTPESAGPLALRRITNREYNHMVSALLGDTTAPADGFPLDGPSVTGFEAPNGVADLNVEYYYQTAEALASAALAAGTLAVPCTNPTAAQEAGCAGQFVDQFGQRAYRRPVSATEKTGLLAIFSTARQLGFAFNDAISQMAKAMLQSSGFLYHWELGPEKPAVDANGLVALTQYQVASRLAMLLWEDMPDDTLLAAAGAGQLATADQVQAQATRMLDDPRAANSLFNFYKQLLLQVNGHVTDVTDITKTSPLFTDAVKNALTGEFTQFLTSVYSNGGDGTLGSLLTAPYAFVNADTAPIYGVAATGANLARVQLDPAQRGGILTQAAFLASEADPSADNPVRRGLVVYLNLLCGEVGPVPDVVPPVSPPSGTLTTRERFDEHGASACASSCHELFDPPGFAFENYDAIGSFRTTESGKNVDASGTLTTPGMATISFKNGVELGQKLAQSDEVKWCLDRQWFRYMLGRMESAAEQGSLEVAYRKALETNGYSLRDMLIAMTGSMAFRYRTPSAGEPL